MALVKCPECGKDVSDTIEACIHCGYRLKKEPAVLSQQPNADVKAPKKRKSSGKYLTIGITLFLGVLIVATIAKFTAPENIAGNILYLVVAIISFSYSLALLAVPKIRKPLFVFLYLVVNAAATCCIFYDFDDITCYSVLFVPLVIAIFVSFLSTFVSIFIKDEKQ